MKKKIESQEEVVKVSQVRVSYRELIGTERNGSVATKDFTSKKEAEAFIEATGGKLV